MHKAFGWWVSLFLVSACSRSQPAPPRVEPLPAPPPRASTAVPTPTAPAPPPPPPAPVDGPVNVLVANGREVTPTGYRVDGFALAALGNECALTVQHTQVRRVESTGGDTDEAGTVEVRSASQASFTLAADGSAVTAGEQSGLPVLRGGQRARLLGGVGLSEGGSSAPEDPRAHAFYLGNGDFVVHSGAEGYVGAALGHELECDSEDGILCPDGRPYTVMRSTAQDVFDGRSGWALRVATRASGALGGSTLFRVACRARGRSWRQGDEVLGSEVPAVIPDSRCSGIAHPEVPAVAFHPRGSAVAWRMSRQLFVVRLTPAGAPVGAPQVFARGDVGAPTLAWRGDNLVAVWAGRARPAQPYQLQYAEWDPSAALDPAAVHALETGAAPAFAPALWIGGGRTVLAWTEGTEQRASVRVGHSLQGFATLVQNARAVSTDAQNARDPELAFNAEGTLGWMVWTVRPANTRPFGTEARVYSSPLRLP